MNFDIVNLYYPNEWRRAGGFDPSGFNWFLCSYRILDPDSNLYYIAISPDVQFFCPKTGKSLIARGLSKYGEGIETEKVRPRLIILSDPHNKRVLCKKYNCQLRCNSKRSTLSTECTLVVDKEHLIDMTRKIVHDLGFDGAAIRHECINSALDRPDMPVCQEATFVFKEGVLEDLGELWPARCGIIKFAKKNNSCIRKIINTFPTCSEIDETLEKYPCPIVSKVLYEYITDYMEQM
jgi:hypothetical protein